MSNMLYSAILAVTTLATNPALVAQRGPGGGTPPTNTLTTATDFAALADLGGTIAHDSVANGTTGARIAAHARVSTGRRTDTAFATSTVRLMRNPRAGDGVQVHEHGVIRNSDAMRGATVGTSADAGGATAPTTGAHSVQVAYPAIAQGADAIVTIVWMAHATAGASATADVDVDGDGTPDFSATADGNPASAVLQVVAGGSGIAIHITTNASAGVAADGHERYDAALAVFVREGTLPTSCTFTNFGTNCGADLNGSVGPSLDLALDLTNGPADAPGFILIGDQLAAPIPLPNGVCNLLVDSRFGHGIRFRTDASGAATRTLRTPTSAMTVSFQALVLMTDPTTGAHSLGASNGTALVCQ